MSPMLLIVSHILIQEVLISGSNPLLISNFLSTFPSLFLQPNTNFELVVLGNLGEAPDNFLPSTSKDNFTIVKILSNASYPVSGPVSKHGFACSVFLVQVQNINLVPIPILDLSKNNLLNAYFVFIALVTQLMVNSFPVEYQLSILANLTRPLKNTIFLVTTPNRLQAFIPENLQERRVFKIYDYSSSLGGIVENLEDALISGSKVNMHKEWIFGIVCPRCVPKDRNSKEVPTPLVRTFYQLSIFVNATAGFKIPQGEMHSSARTQPLLDGTGTIALPSTLGQGDLSFHVTDVALFHSYTFVTGHPRKVSITSLLQLAQPFSTSVWALTLTFVVGIFLAIEMISYFKRRKAFKKDTMKSNHLVRTENKFLHIWWTVVLLQPILDQAIISKELVPKLSEYELVKPDCYQLVFEHNGACIGPSFVFWFLGSIYMTSAKKQLLFVESKDTLFTELMTAGMSIQYPYLVGMSSTIFKKPCWIKEPYNFIWSGLYNSGIFQIYWESQVLDVKLKQGKVYAGKHSNDPKYSAGKTNDISNQRIISLSLQIIIYGIILAAAALVGELLTFFFLMSREHTENS
ncbi:unnamed protein product [Allacma fusca]|uniref:Uncharacterized protein n=1 Tax=Allacma fusca TaxID=39272 RepID=A0A8J2PLV8_9HEXA|nr:unnamed protein product [Allacma fusca]